MKTSLIYLQMPDPKPAPAEEPNPGGPEIEPPIPPDTPVPTITA